MTSLRRRSTAALLALAWALASASPPESPGRAVDEALQRARSIVVEDGDRTAKLLSLHELAGELLDTRAMGHRAIGRELAQQSAAEQSEFLELFDVLMVRTYLQKLLLFRDPRFAVVAEDAQEGAIFVRTRIYTSKDEFLVDYEMRRTGDRWRATDVVIEGVSLTRTYRSQLRSLLKSHTFAELLDRIRRKTRTLSEPRGV